MRKQRVPSREILRNTRLWVIETSFSKSSSGTSLVSLNQSHHPGAQKEGYKNVMALLTLFEMSSMNKGFKALSSNIESVWEIWPEIQG